MEIWKTGKPSVEASILYWDTLSQSRKPYGTLCGSERYLIRIEESITAFDSLFAFLGRYIYPAGGLGDATYRRTLRAASLLLSTGSTSI